jgi:hypothetical protein
MASTAPPKHSSGERKGHQRDDQDRLEATLGRRLVVEPTADRERFAVDLASDGPVKDVVRLVWRALRTLSGSIVLIQWMRWSCHS